MKMKSNVFGHSAKLALAVLAVCGTLFTSCYEKEEIDNPNLGEAEYFIAGTITDAKTGSPMTAKVKVGNQTEKTVTGSFKSEKLTYTPEPITVVVSADQYNTFTKQVYLSKVGQGAIYIGDASVALVSLGSIDVPGKEVESPADAVDTANKALTDAMLQPGNAGGDAGTITFDAPTRKEGATSLTVTYPATFANKIESGNVDYISYQGFELISDVKTVTRASSTELFKAGIVSLIGKQEGIAKTKTVKSIALPAWANFSISGYKVVYTFVPRTYTLTFDGADHTGTVVSQEGITIYPVYFNHDTHSSHDGHGLNPNAGGGSGGY